MTEKDECPHEYALCGWDMSEGDTAYIQSDGRVVRPFWKAVESLMPGIDLITHRCSLCGDMKVLISEVSLAEMAEEKRKPLSKRRTRASSAPVIPKTPPANPYTTSQHP